MTERVRDWIQVIGADLLPIDHQRILALRDSGEPLSVANIRQRLAMDGEDVRNILESLVTDNWLDYPRHRNEPYLEGRRLREIPGVATGSAQIDRASSSDTETRIRACFEKHDELSTQTVAAMAGLHPNTVRRYLTQLTDSGWLIAIGPSTSPRRTYRKK